MSDATFTCDRCGRDFPESQMKEVFVGDGGQEVKKTVCPSCLDEILQQSDKAVGVEGDEKRAAVAIDEAAHDSGRRSYGERGTDTTGAGPRSG